MKTGGRKGGTAGPPSDGILRIATNLLDPPADVDHDLLEISRRGLGLFGLGGGLVTERRFDDS